MISCNLGCLVKYMDYKDKYYTATRFTQLPKRIFIIT